jgi:hypothetical protein
LESRVSNSRKRKIQSLGSWRISAVDHVGGEVSGIQIGVSEVRNLSAVDLASREIPKSERCGILKDLGPIGFRGSGSQETELHVNATPEIAKRKKPKGGS